MVKNIFLSIAEGSVIEKNLNHSKITKHEWF